MGRTYRKRRRYNQMFIRNITVRGLYSWIVAKGFRPSKCNLRLAVTSSGRGMVCQNAVQPGDIIISLPESLLITESKVRASIPNLPNTFSIEEILTAFIIAETRLGSYSTWQPYISSLPAEFNSLFTYKQLDKLPRGLQLAFDRWCTTALRSWRNLSKYFQAVKADDVSESEFLWSWCVVNTRCIYVEGHGGVLAPFLDMLNHHWTASVNTQFKEGHFVIISNSRYEPGEEVFISYGNYDNRTLLQNYGFVLDDNPNDCVPIERHHLDLLHAVKKFTRFDQKIALIEKREFLTNQTGFTVEGATWNLIVILNILEDCTPHGVSRWKLHMIQSTEETSNLELVALLAEIVLDAYPNDIQDYTLKKLVQIEKQILYKLAIHK
ncbi:SET domain-containing protein 4-like isoform X2 [Varroa jacobsoni]|uniref:SET domain-containing protein n=1 Tax=Varroa destructor TaxID=109461 RepID=A0A7M7JAL4_VARDE|nr:SET domain-containing protein 4-like isoform X3 [Varroa destructor]XP_022704940.1 SET domain-containing protein 4-like isoform X2 [Varroa jacobsoni]